MGKKEKEKTTKKADSGKSEKKGEKKAAVADKPGTAKYTYPADCTTDSDKKKYRSLMRAEKPWPGPGATEDKVSKKGKKDPGVAGAVILDGKGKKVREEKHTESEAAPKKKKKVSKED